MVFNRCVSDIFTKVYQQGDVVVVKRPPFQGVRQVSEDLAHLFHKFVEQGFGLSGYMASIVTIAESSSRCIVSAAKIRRA
jgi:hypothetical protein